MNFKEDVFAKVITYITVAVLLGAMLVEAFVIYTERSEKKEIAGDVYKRQDEILEQIEKQVSKLVDVRDIRELKPEESVYRELALIKVKVSAEKRQDVIAITNIFRANIIDVGQESLIVEITGCLLYTSRCV